MDVIIVNLYVINIVYYVKMEYAYNVKQEDFQIKMFVNLIVVMDYLLVQMKNVMMEIEMMEMVAIFIV